MKGWVGGVGGFLSPLLLRQSPVPFRGCMGGQGRRVASKSFFEFLEREGLQPLLMTVCHRGPAPPSRENAGAGPRGDRPGKKKEAGPEKIYRETEILTCTWGP